MDPFRPSWLRFTSTSTTSYPTHLLGLGREGQVCEFDLSVLKLLFDESRVVLLLLVLEPPAPFELFLVQLVRATVALPYCRARRGLLLLLKAGIDEVVLLVGSASR